MKQIICSDIDNTIVDNTGSPILYTVRWLRAASQYFDIVFITGRHEDRRQMTETLLKRLRIEYSSLLMDNTGIPYGHTGEASRARMKARDVIQLQKTDDVILFVDDSRANRAAIKQLGVLTKKPWNLDGKLLDHLIDKA